MKSPGIHMRFLVSVWAMILVIVVLLGTVGGQVAETFMRERFQEHMGTLARYLALNAELGVILEDREMLERLCKNLLQEQDVMAVTVSKALNEKPLVQLKKMRFAPSLPQVEHAVMLSSRLEENLIYETNAGDAANEKPLGTVIIHYSRAGIDELIDGMKSRFFFIIIGVALFFSACFYWISRSLVSPLKRLVNAATEVARKGDLNVKVDGGNLPETRILADSFREMLLSLAQSRADLDRTYQEMLRQQALAELGKFSMMVAHEIKNPLGIIRGSLDVLKKPDLPRDMQATMVSYMENELGRLNRLVEDFLRFARPRSPHFEPTDLNALLKDTIDRFALEMEDASRRIALDVPPGPLWGEVDGDMMAQALRNVVKNALEAAAPEGKVWISSRTLNGHCRIVVRDEGPGIPKEARDRIFEPFYTTKSQGTGLGLALVLRILQQHGGSAELLNLEKGGGGFRLVFPVKHKKDENGATERGK